MTALSLSLTVSGCHKTHNDGPTGAFSPATNFVIFKDELQSGGGAFEFPGNENQSLAFNDTSNPISRRSIRYTWNGGPVSNPGCAPNPTHLFAGFDLMHTPLQANYLSAAGRDLRNAGYNKVTFYARGDLKSRTIMKVEVAGAGTAPACGHAFSPCISLSTNGTDDDPDPATACGNTGQLTSDWKSFTINIRPQDEASIKDFFKATFIFSDLIPTAPAAGQGGTVYFDQIQYVP